MPSNLEGKNFVSKFPGYCPQNTMVFFSSKLDGIKKYFCRQYLQNLNALIFWFKYLQKVNVMPSDFWWKKKQVLPHWWIFFDPFFKGSKDICQRGKTLFFSSEIWGHCIYILQVIKSEDEGIQILQVLPAKSISCCHLILMKKMPLYSEGNTLGILRRSFFP